MDCKLSVTTVCGARCATCPVWRGPRATMEFEDFRIVWDKLMASPMISRVLLNNTGDMNTLAKRMLYFMHIEANYRKPVVMTTNGVNLDYIRTNYTWAKAGERFVEIIEKHTKERL